MFGSSYNLLLSGILCGKSLCVFKVTYAPVVLPKRGLIGVQFRGCIERKNEEELEVNDGDIDNVGDVENEGGVVNIEGGVVDNTRDVDNNDVGVNVDDVGDNDVSIMTNERFLSVLS